MRIVQINATCGRGSTGKICVAVSQLLNQEKIENYILYTGPKSNYSNGIHYASTAYLKYQALRSRINGKYGFTAFWATMKLIRQLEKIQPEIVHLHNIHGHNAHLGMLFSYFKQKKIKLFWTFHDCWAFTGYCPHFLMEGCSKWKEQCRTCGQAKLYSWFMDRSTWLFEKKKEYTSGLDMTIITPSKWLGKMVRQSFLGDYPVKVINNGIDLSVFQPTQSHFRAKYNLLNKKIVLGVSYKWDQKKGLDEFIRLAHVLGKEYTLVLVGTDGETERMLPDNVISIRRTANQRDLAGIYTAADVFVNLTQEDTFPTVNIESLACGTPVVTYDVGGSAEMLTEHCGAVIQGRDFQELVRSIRFVCRSSSEWAEACVRQAKHFNCENKYREYLELYR